jgi:hypothetical protein
MPIRADQATIRAVPSQNERGLTELTYSLGTAVSLSPASFSLQLPHKIRSSIVESSEHEPKPASHETTTPPHLLLAKDVFVNFSGRRRLKKPRCMYPKGVHFKFSTPRMHFWFLYNDFFTKMHSWFLYIDFPVHVRSILYTALRW